MHRRLRHQLSPTFQSTLKYCESSPQFQRHLVEHYKKGFLVIPDRVKLNYNPKPTQQPITILKRLASSPDLSDTSPSKPNKHDPPNLNTAPTELLVQIAKDLADDPISQITFLLTSKRILIKVSGRIEIAIIPPLYKHKHARISLLRKLHTGNRPFTTTNTNTNTTINMNMNITINRFTGARHAVDTGYDVCDTCLMLRPSTARFWVHSAAGHSAKPAFMDEMAWAKIVNTFCKTSCAQCPECVGRLARQQREMLVLRDAERGERRGAREWCT